MWFKSLLYALPVVLLVSSGYYIYSTQNKITSLIAEKTLLEQENVTLENSLLRVENNVRELEVLNETLGEANREAKQALKAFEDSNLNTLTNSKPVLIERIINRGTNNLFEEFERESQ